MDGSTTFSCEEGSCSWRWPWLYLLFAVRAALPLHISEWQVFLLLVAVIGLIGWARPARLIGGVVLSAKERNFVIAARGFGASDAYLLRRHVLPQTGGVVLTQMTLLIPQYVLAEVTLTFLGLGAGEPMPSWGSLLSSLQQYYVLSSYWWMCLPALLLVPSSSVFTRWPMRSRNAGSPYRYKEKSAFVTI